MSEADLMRRIQIAVCNTGARVMRNNVGAFKDHKGQWVHFGLHKGSSDLIGWTRDGKFLALEVKMPTGKPTPEQINFIEQVRKAGGIAGIVRSVDEALALLTPQGNA